MHEALEPMFIALFLGTIDGQTLDEALLNLELEAETAGWSREGVRAAASTIRLRYARKVA